MPGAFGTAQCLLAIISSSNGWAYRFQRETRQSDLSLITTKVVFLFVHLHELSQNAPEICRILKSLTLKLKLLSYLSHKQCYPKCRTLLFRASASTPPCQSKVMSAVIESQLQTATRFTTEVNRQDYDGSRWAGKTSALQTHTHFSIL